MGHVLREYQEQRACEVSDLWRSNDAVLCVMATGTGKTHLFVEVAHRRGGRALFLAHRRELIGQAAAKIEAVTGYAPAVEMADQRVGSGWFGLPDMIVSSVQTQASRMPNGRPRREKFDPWAFDTLVVDEAHRAASVTYRETIAWYRRNPKLRVLGVTATPDRGDGQALGKVFTAHTTPYDVRAAVADGYLVPPLQGYVYVDSLQLEGIKTVAGDFAGRALSEEVEKEANVHAFAAGILEQCGDSRSIVFCARVAQAEMLSAVLNAHKPTSAVVVSAKTPEDERAELLGRHRDGGAQYLVNVDVATEGYDDPGVVYCVMCRPTKARSRYVQAAGRVMRPLPGIVDGLADAAARRAAIAASAKPSCIVLDFCGHEGQHDLACVADILGGDYSDEAKREARATLSESRTPADMVALLDTIEARREAERRAQEERDRQAAAMKIRSARVRTRMVDPLTALPGFRLAPVRPGQPMATEKQIEYLEKSGIDASAMTREQARSACYRLNERRRKGLATPKQMKLLAGWGYDGERVTIREASSVIDAMFALPRGSAPLPPQHFGPDLGARLAKRGATPPVKQRPAMQPPPPRLPFPAPPPLMRQLNLNPTPQPVNYDTEEAW